MQLICIFETAKNPPHILVQCECVQAHQLLSGTVFNKHFIKTQDEVYLEITLFIMQNTSVHHNNKNVSSAPFTKILVGYNLEVLFTTLFTTKLILGYSALQCNATPLPTSGAINDLKKCFTSNEQ